MTTNMPSAFKEIECFHVSQQIAATKGLELFEDPNPTNKLVGRPFERPSNVQRW